VVAVSGQNAFGHTSALANPTALLRAGSTVSLHCVLLFDFPSAPALNTCKRGDAPKLGGPSSIIIAALGKRLDRFVKGDAKGTPALFLETKRVTYGYSGGAVILQVRPSQPRRDAELQLWTINLHSRSGRIAVELRLQ
jgi:hypothetical protein